MTGQQHHKPWCASLSSLTAKPRPCDCVRVPLPTTPGSAARSADSAEPFCKPWVALTLDEKHALNDALNLGGRFVVMDVIEAKVRGKNA